MNLCPAMLHWQRVAKFKCPVVKNCARADAKWASTGGVPDGSESPIVLFRDRHRVCASRRYVYRTIDLL